MKATKQETERGIDHLTSYSEAAPVVAHQPFPSFPGMGKAGLTRVAHLLRKVLHLNSNTYSTQKF